MLLLPDVKSQEPYRFTATVTLDVVLKDMI